MSNRQQKLRDRIEDALWGCAIGDALGVPVEFSSYAARLGDPVTEMREFGTWHQPRGTWSDDTSMMLGLARALADHGDEALLNPALAAENYRLWLHENHFNAHGKVFDSGSTCSSGISAFAATGSLRNNTSFNSNGNGSLMRLMPLSIWLAVHTPTSLELSWTLQSVVNDSAITHGHPIAHICCFIHARLVRHLIAGAAFLQSVNKAADDLARMTAAFSTLPEAGEVFFSLLSGLRGIVQAALERRDLEKLDGEDLFGTFTRSGGYVVTSLKIALWACATSISFEEAVLKAVNQGGDTDTNACITGGLAALAFRTDTPRFQEWSEQLVNTRMLGDIFDAFLARVLTMPDRGDSTVGSDQAAE